jgi:hypothetical protein
MLPKLGDGRWLWAGWLAVILTGCAGSAPRGRVVAVRPLPRVELVETNDVVRVTFDGRLFTEYHFRNVPRPFLYPLLDARGSHLTRRWPMEEAPGEEHDHPHHRSFWFTHGEVNGHDLWSESDKSGRQVHQYFVTKQSGDDAGVLTTRNEWRARDGKLLATDERTMRFHRPKGAERVVDFEITLFPRDGDLTLGDTKEGTFALRVAESLRVTQPKGRPPGTGVLVNSRGQRNGAVWGQRAEWADYSGTVDGQTVGLAIFDHPANPRHPTWWHARDYGLFAANPFGVHDFEKKPKGEGDLKVPAGTSVTFRYRVYVHPGDAQQAGVAERYAEYVRTAPVKP